MLRLGAGAGGVGGVENRLVDPALSLGEATIDRDRASDVSGVEGVDLDAGVHQDQLAGLDSAVIVDPVQGVGVVAGCGVALLRARAALENLHTGNADQDAGVQIVLRAVESPLRQIVANAGGEPSVVVNKVLEGKGNYGYNAGSGEYGDMIEMGVLDPAKVTRSALQHAASIAGLMLTTDCMIAEIPEEKPAMPDMGGMGGMGGMM